MKYNLLNLFRFHVSSFYLLCEPSGSTPYKDGCFYDIDEAPLLALRT